MPEQTPEVKECPRCKKLAAEVDGLNAERQEVVERARDCVTRDRAMTAGVALLAAERLAFSGERKELAAHVAKWKSHAQRAIEREGVEQARRMKAENALAADPQGAKASLEARISALVEELGRAEATRRDQKAKIDEYEGALNEAQAVLMKADVPVPVEGYVGAPIRLAPDIASALAEAKAGVSAVTKS